MLSSFVVWLVVGWQYALVWLVVVVVCGNVMVWAEWNMQRRYDEMVARVRMNDEDLPDV